MNIFSLNNNLKYICNSCFCSYDRKMKACTCGTSLFKVARMFPLINYPLDRKDKQHDQESGYFFSDRGDFSTSVGGAEVYQFLNQQEGGDDDVGTPGATSDELLQTEPMRDIVRNRSGRDRVYGPHMMNSNMPTSTPHPSVFVKTKNKMTHEFMKGYDVKR